MASIEYLTDTNKSDSLCTSTPSLSTVVNTTMSSTIKCKRVGCENPSIEHPEWDGEYCSARCLSVFCKYDNEYGYNHRVVDLIQHMAKMDNENISNTNIAETNMKQQHRLHQSKDKR